MSKNILLIDDDPDDAMFFSKALDDLNLATNFRYVGDGSTTLQELVKKDAYVPDIIFLDINMPMTDGWECLRELKSLAEFGRIPVIMYSTADLENEGMNATDVGATAFMRKPTNFADFKSRLSAIIGSIFLC